MKFVTCMLVASVLSYLVIRTRRFWKIKEKKSKKNINNDLAVVASHILVEVVYDITTQPTVINHLHRYLTSHHS